MEHNRRKEIVHLFASYSGEVRDLKDIVEYAIRCCGLCLEYVSDRWRDDEEMAREAVECDMEAFEFVSERLRGDADFVLSLLPCMGSPYIYHCFHTAFPYICSDLLDSADFLLRAIDECRSISPGTRTSVFVLALEHASSRLRDDELFVMEALKTLCGGLFSASDRLRKQDQEQGQEDKLPVLFCNSSSTTSFLSKHHQRHQSILNPLRLGQFGSITELIFLHVMICFAVTFGIVNEEVAIFKLLCLPTPRPSMTVRTL